MKGKTMTKTGSNGRRLATLACAAGLLAAAQAAQLELAWTLKDGRVEKETAPLVEKDGALTFSLSAAAIRAKGAKELAATPDFATATKGEDGYWVVPTGQYGTFRCDKGRYSCSWPSMSMFGMKTPRKTFVAFVTGLKY